MDCAKITAWNEDRPGEHAHDFFLAQNVDFLSQGFCSFFDDFGLRHKSHFQGGATNYRYAIQIENLVLVY